MSLHYKFKSSLEFDTVTFDGLHISVADLKKAIFHQKRIGKNTDFDLQITNAQTKEVYKDETALIAKNTSLIISRVPLTNQQKKAWSRAEALSHASNSTAAKEDANLGKSVDLTRLDGSEEDKIRAMMTQSTQDYDPSNYIKIRGCTQTGEVPANYRCFRCHQPGHWIKNCPLGNHLEPVEIKKSTGIPRSFMVPVEGPRVPGAMMTPGGTYAVPAIDHQAYKEGKKEKPPFSQEQQPQVDQPEIPEDLLCIICKDLLTDAVMVACCGKSFCDECIRTLLLESEDHECPDCNEKDVSPDSLIPNRFLRNGVLSFKNCTGYTKGQTSKSAQAVQQGSASELSETAASTPSKSSQNASSLEPPIKEAEKAPDSRKTVRATGIITEAKLVPEQHSDGAQKDEETEVVPPGTEPAVLPKRLSSDHSWHDNREDEYWYCKDRRRGSFSKEHGRDRHYLSNRLDSMRPSGRRRSLSPRHQSDYHHFEKPYLPHHTSDSRYHHPIHYDPSVENRAGTPTVDEPHLHPPPMMAYGPPEAVVPQPSYPSATIPPTAPMITDPYMVHQQRMPMYPPHQSVPPHAYVPPPRYDRYQGGYRPSGGPRGYGGPRPPRGMHGRYRMGMQQSLRALHNGVQGLIDDPLEAFNRMLREKDERERRTKHRKRTRSRSPRSRSYSRSRSRSYGRAKVSRSRSPPLPKRRSSRSPTSHKNRSRTPKRRSRSRSLSLSRSRSYSRSPSPRKRDRDHERPREPLTRYKSPGRSPSRYHKDTSRSSRDYAYYPTNTIMDPPGYEAPYRDSGRARYPPRIPSQPLPPGPTSMMVPPLAQAAPNPAVIGHLPPDGKDYYDSYNRYPTGSAPRFTPVLPAKGFPDVAPPGTEGYYDVPPPGVEVPPPAARKSHEKDHEVDRSHDREERERRNEREKEDREKTDRKDDRDRRETHKDSKHSREYEKDRRDYEKDRYKEDRDRHADDKRRRSDRRDRDYEYERESTDRHRHERYEKSTSDKKRPKRSSSPYTSKYRSDAKENSPDRHKKRDKDHEDKPEERRKEKKIKEKKKKKDSDEKKKKKKKEKKANFQKEAIAAAAAAAAAVSSIPVVLKVKKEPEDDMRAGNGIPKKEPEDSDLVRIKTEPPDNPPLKIHQMPTIRSVTQVPNLIRIHTKPMPTSAQIEDKIPEKPVVPETPPLESIIPAPVESSLVLEGDQEMQGQSIPAGDFEDVFEQEGDEEAVEAEVCEAEEEEEEDEEEEEEEDEEEEESQEALEQMIEAEMDAPTPKQLDEYSFEPKTPSEPPADGDNDQAEETLQLNESNEFITDHDELIINSQAVLQSQVVEQEPHAQQLHQQQTGEGVKTEDSDEGEEGEILEDDGLDEDEENRENSGAKIDALATIPEPSKWEKDDGVERNDDEIELHANEKLFLDKDDDSGKSGKMVTTEVLKRAENAIFQKAINAIRPIEIKKISENRKVLYQNPDSSKIIEIESDHEQEPRKVNVTVSVGKIDQRSVEFRPESGSSSNRRSKSDKSKSKSKNTSSPTRPSIKDRLGEKVKGDDAEVGSAHKLLFGHRGDLKDNGTKSTRSPRVGGRRLSISMDDEPIITNSDRKVIIESADRKRDRLRRDRNSRKEDLPRIHDRSESRKVERIVRTPPLNSFKTRKDLVSDEKDDRRRDKKVIKDDKKRKKEHRSRSKSKERKKRRDRKHRREKEHLKVEKSKDDSKNISKSSDPSDQIIDVDNYKKQRRNLRIVGERKRTLIKDSNIEPEYSTSISETDDEGKASSLAKRAKLVDNTVIIESDVKPAKKRVKPSSSDEEESSSSEESSSESDSSLESHRKKKKKHKKRKKRKIRKESSSESEAYSDSSESSSEEEKHRKKKKSKSKNKASKKKKKSKHK